MDINDYLIEQEGKDCAGLLSAWSGALPPSVTLRLLNRFGDIFFVSANRAVLLLHVGKGVVGRLADSCDEFIARIDVGENAGGWLLIQLVNQSDSEGMVVSANQFYGYKVPPILAGTENTADLEPTAPDIHYSFLAGIFVQTKDLPDGTPIRVVVQEPN
jgi:hypothetical protein